MAEYDELMQSAYQSGQKNRTHGVLVLFVILTFKWGLIE